jgi:hypothetical protein
MRLRMSRTERREQLLKIMCEMHVKAESQNDFTVRMIAREACVSVVWVNRLVQPEFRMLRSKLLGSHRSGKTVERKLRQQIAELSSRLAELKSKYEANIKGDFAAAIRHIEDLDRECRIWRAKAELLESRFVASQGSVESLKSLMSVKNEEADLGESMP